jgi:hypothetical protein
VLFRSKRKYGLTDGVKHNRKIIWRETKIGCWKCTSHKLSKGYARSKDNLIAKVLWIKKNGTWPNNMIMRHLCGNKWCVNPDHVKPGTQWENNIDTILSGKIIAQKPVCEAMLMRAVGECIIMFSNNKIIRLEDGKSFDMPSYMIEGGDALLMVNTEVRK